MTADLRVIDCETTRDIAATCVHAEFAKATEALVKETGRMSAFFIVAFDDQGNPTSQMYLGEFFPMPSPMLPGIVGHCIVAQVYNP